MYEVITLYNNGNALRVADRGDYVELLTLNDKQKYHRQKTEPPAVGGIMAGLGI